MPMLMQQMLSRSSKLLRLYSNCSIELHFQTIIHSLPLEIKQCSSKHTAFPFFESKIPIAAVAQYLRHQKVANLLSFALPLHIKIIHTCIVTQVIIAGNNLHCFWLNQVVMLSKTICPRSDELSPSFLLMANT